jgi:hypothetical protein
MKVAGSGKGSGTEASWTIKVCGVPSIDGFSEPFTGTKR